MNEKELTCLRRKLLEYFEDLGFKINPHLHPKKNSKNFLRKLHEYRRHEQLKNNYGFLTEAKKCVKKYYINKKIHPEKIELELKFVDEIDSEEYILFKWWNIVWWSLPYEKSVGRIIRYMLYDTHHDLPFGLVVLQSPILRCKARDEYLGIGYEDRDYWINQSLYAQRVGALPPYNKILGGKLVAMSLCSKEIRDKYFKKYNGKKTTKKKIEIPARLLFISTLSAFGRSEMYENLNYNGNNLSIFVGYTKGAGTFHIPDDIYRQLLSLLGEDVDTSAFVSPSRKIKLIAKSLRILGLNNFEYHNIKRGIYLFPHAKNLREIIMERKKPEWYNFDFASLFEYWQNKICKKDRLEINWRKIFNIIK